MQVQLEAPTGVRAAARATRTSISLDLLLARRREFLRFLERRLSSPALAEDILQNAYVRALEHATDLRTDESAPAWFYRILRNSVIDHYRHRTVEDHALAEWANELETEVAANDLTQDVVCRCIARVLPTMNPGYAGILREVDLDEGTLTAYAAGHAITIPNATVRIHRARKALKQRLTETCGACATHHCMHCNCIG